MADEPSILIIGAGTFGTSTAYHLAKTYNDPSKVTVIDRAPSPPKPAASIDINRIIRPDYPNSLYCNLAWEAIHSWFWGLELQEFFRQHGGVMLTESKENHQKIKEVFKGRGYDQTEDIALDQLTKDERCKATLNGTATDGFHGAYWNPDAGWVNAAKATASYMHEAQKYGVNRVTAEVEKLVYDSGRITGVKTKDGQTLNADKVILASGAWTSSLLSPIEDALDIAEADRIERQIRAAGVVSAYYKATDDELELLNKSPVVMYGDRGQVIPASPENRLIKYTNSQTMFINTITTSSGHKISAPSDRSQYSVPEKLKQETHDVVISKVLPQFAKGKEADHWRICWDARTPTQDWLMCRHPHEKLTNLYLAVGGSFQGYK
jgi:sarcosine oxidase / L-pipecolate oxidase